MYGCLSHYRIQPYLVRKNTTLFLYLFNDITVLFDLCELHFFFFYIFNLNLFYR